MKIFHIYFSPTGGTKKAGEYLTQSWRKDVEEINLSDYGKDFSQIKFCEEDVCYVSVPSFGGRVPTVATERITQMKGYGAKAVAVCVYGNRAYEDTLLELTDTLTARGFSCVAGTAAIAEHSIMHGAKAVAVCVYGNRAYEDTLLELTDTLTARGFSCVAGTAAIAEHSIMHQFASGRPDKEDKNELLEFGGKIRKKIEQFQEYEDLHIPGNCPYKKLGVSSMIPQSGDGCINCKICARECPVAAIEPEEPQKTNADRCIACMHCIAICPEHARKLNPEAVAALTERVKDACQGPEEPQKTNADRCIACMHCIAICPEHARKLNPEAVAALTERVKDACQGRKQNELFL